MNGEKTTVGFSSGPWLKTGMFPVGSNRLFDYAIPDQVRGKKGRVRKTGYVKLDLSLLEVSTSNSFIGISLASNKL